MSKWHSPCGIHEYKDSAPKECLICKIHIQATRAAAGNAVSKWQRALNISKGDPVNAPAQYKRTAKRRRTKNRNDSDA